MTAPKNPTDLLVSKATEEDRDLYTQGACHHLAIALNRKFGWIMDVRTDDGEPYWQDEADAENFIPSVLHVYAIDPQGRAWDVCGCRSERMIPEEIEEQFFPSSPSSDECGNEELLKGYVGCWAEDGSVEPIDRPLDEYSESDIEKAWQVALRIFEGLNGFAPTQARPLTRHKPGFR